LENIIVYCPASIHLFRNMSLNDFYEQDLDEQYVWDDAQAQNQTLHLGLFRREMKKYGYDQMEKEPPLSPKYTETERHLTQIDLDLEEHNGRLWLGISCSADKQMQGNELELLKEYLAERIDSEADRVSQWGYFEYGPDVLAILFEATDMISPSCAYPVRYEDQVEANHLLLKSEMEQEVGMSMKENGSSGQEPSL